MEIHSRVKLRLAVPLFFALTISLSVSGPEFAGSQKDRAAIQRTGVEIRAAFARGDVDGIMVYHHPDVIKALVPGEQETGAQAVRTGLAATFKDFSLRFDESYVESTYFEGNTAVEVSRFAIRGTPKADGKPFVFRGRSMVVYVRYAKSPSGWASIRELIQPSP